MAEAQLTNVTRQKFKEAYDLHTAAIIERAEKQIILARTARRVLNYLDDTPVVPGQDRQAFEHGDAVRDILNEADDAIRGWSSNVDTVHSTAGTLGSNAVPMAGGHAEHHDQASIEDRPVQQSIEGGAQAEHTGQLSEHSLTTGSTVPGSSV